MSAADRPVAHIVSSRWSNEEARDRLNEAGTVVVPDGIMAVPAAAIRAWAQDGPSGAFADRDESFQFRPLLRRQRDAELIHDGTPGGAAVARSAPRKQEPRLPVNRRLTNQLVICLVGLSPFKQRDTCLTRVWS